MLPFYVPYIKKLFDIGKKVLLVGIVYFVVGSFLLHFINKDRPRFTTDPIKRNRAEIYTTIQTLKKNNTAQGKTSLLTYRMVICGLVGEACTDKPEDGDRNFNNSAFGLISKMILLPYQNPPASGIIWAVNGLQNAGLIPKAYAAQGIGFGIMQPFSKIWVVLRDLAYTVLVLFIIAIGFMIMFRMKLNPQTVISVENALPKIVVALILITFSFAIAGFLIDLMYLLIAIIVSLLGPMFKPETFGGPLNLSIPGAPQGTPQEITQQLQQRYLSAHPGDILSGLQKEGSLGFWTIFFTLPNALLDLVPLIGSTVKIVGTILSIFLLVPFINDHLTAPVENSFRDLLSLTLGLNLGATGTVHIGDILKGIFTPGIHMFAWGLVIWIGAVLFVPFIVGLCIFFTVIFIFFRIFFTLFASYIKILLLTVISPIYLLFEAVPGQSAFSGWLKSLLAELIAFPMIVGILLMGTIISDAASSGSIIQLPFLVGIDPKNFGFIVGMALLFMTPDLIKSVKQVLVPKPGILDAGGLGLFFGGATTGISGGLGELQKYAGIGYYIKPVRDILQKIPGGKQIFATPGGDHPPS